MEKQSGFLKYVFLVFAFVIVVADACLILMHNKKFSENENRVLQQVPELTLDSLVSGKFMTESENFVADQFFIRDQWIQFKVAIDRSSGRTESGDVLLGKEGYLLEKIVTPNEEFLQKNLNAVNEFAAVHENLNIRMAVIPNAAQICKQLLPANAPVRDQAQDLLRIQETLALCPTENLKYVDVSDALSEANKVYSELSATLGNEDLADNDETAAVSTALYYKSDHHWTSFGAKTAWDVIAPELGIDLPAYVESAYASYENAAASVFEDTANESIEETADGNEEELEGSDAESFTINIVDGFRVMTATTGFSGTMASSSGCFNVKDTIEIYVPIEESLEYVVEYAEEQTKSATIYDSTAFSRKNQYEVFLGGNHPQINIKTTVQNTRNLLLLKDSYANCLVQFLLPHYHTITIIDPRYYSDDLNKIIEEKSITDVLILYNMNTFALDNNLAGVLVDATFIDSAVAGE